MVAQVPVTPTTYPVVYYIYNQTGQSWNFFQVEHDAAEIEGWCQKQKWTYAIGDPRKTTPEVVGPLGSGLYLKIEIFRKIRLLNFAKIPTPIDRGQKVD